MTAAGHVDALTSSGYLEGWAHDPERPGHALEIAVLVQDREVGRGLANRFRWDLADVGCGIGWCAFRLRVDGAVSALRRGPVVVMDVIRKAEIYRTGQLPVIEDSEIYPIDIGRSNPDRSHRCAERRSVARLWRAF